jgi:hypothetical protein
MLTRLPEFRRRTHHPREVVMFYGLVRTIEEPRGTVAAWARSMLEELQDVVADPEFFAPARLSENPFWIWGGAVLDKFSATGLMPPADRDQSGCYILVLLAA